MLALLRQLLPSGSPAGKPQPRTNRPRFRPGIERLDDRLTPALGFSAQQTFAVGAGPWGAQAADFNADGRVDLVTAGTTANALSVLVNTTPNGGTTPAFAAKQDFAVLTTPFNVEVGDMNGDGRPDLVATNNPNVVSILLNTTPAGSSSVSFAPKQDITVTGVSEIALGDFNSDGRLDLATVLQGTDSVSIRLNTTPMQGGVVTFGLIGGTFGVGDDPFDITVGDFNADGRIDLATTNVISSNVSVLLNTTGIGSPVPTFSPKQDFTVGTVPLGVAVGDLNGDGRLDIVAANNSGTVSVLVNTTSAGAPSASFAPKQDFAVGTSTYYVTVDDIDGDGRADLAVVNDGTNNVSVLVNTTATPGSATVSFSKTDFALGGSPRNPVAADFDGDGRPDLAVPNNDDATISVLRNTSTNVKPTTTSPAAVVQLGTTGGVSAYNRATGAWQQLTGANANALAASASGNVIASFGGNGVYYYRASTGVWTKINGLQAVAVAIDPLGNAYVSWTGYGTFMYRLATGTFQQIGGSVANILVAGANGDVVGNFPGFGVYRYQRTAPVPFHQINGFNATSLAVDRNGYVAAAFGGFGVGHYIPYASGWRSVAPAVAATAVALDGYGNVYASLPGFGVGKYNHTNTWKNLAPGASAVTLAADWYGNMFASFAGWPGVWEYNPHYGWSWKQQNPVLLVSLGA